MIHADYLLQAIKNIGIYFFVGVPDSTLKHFTAAIQDDDSIEHITAANEGNAMGIAAGHYLGTYNIPCVYMQNSGFGNAINPIMSLNHVYDIPALLIVGWRGCPFIKDEPQHEYQGNAMLDMLSAAKVNYEIVDEDDDDLSIADVIVDLTNLAIETKKPVVLLVKPGVFYDYTPERSTMIFPPKLRGNGDVEYMKREEAIECILEMSKKYANNPFIISSTGFASRELYELRESNHEQHNHDFMVVGSMGHASQIALGLANADKTANVICIDGDDAAMMHLGGMACIAENGGSNLLHIIIRNGIHDSVGGQDITNRDTNFTNIAFTLGYEIAGVAIDKSITAKKDIEKAFKQFYENPLLENKPKFLDITVAAGHRKDLGRPPKDAIDKESFMQAFHTR